MIICIFTSSSLKENAISELKNFVVILIGFALVLQIFMQSSLRYKSVFWETNMESQNVLIEDGFNAGIYTTEEKHKFYYSRFKILKKLKNYDVENVLYFSNNTWCYLVGDYNMSTYSAWISGVREHSITRLKSYFEINPEKKPDVVYVDKENESFAKSFCDQLGYTIDSTYDAIILVR